MGYEPGDPVGSGGWVLQRRIDRLPVCTLRRGHTKCPSAARSKGSRLRSISEDA